MRSESHFEKIMKAYKSSGDSSQKVVLEAKEKGNIFDGKILRVCAYCRVSTDNEEQLSSFELQQAHYQKLAGDHPNWNLLEIYADEGISGTSLKRRDNFNRMIADCKSGKYDLIVTKSVSRFARNLVDCVQIVRDLKKQNPPVGVYFETDGLHTLAEDSELKLSILATFAQEESIKKSESMVWSLKERFKNKQLLTPAPYGYERPKDPQGNYIKYAKLEIVASEAQIIRLIFDAFLAGYSISSIASILTEAKIPNKLGNTRWHEGSVSYILRNERYCGCVLTWKEFTADIFEHIKRKTKDEREQIFYTNTHDGIIPIEKFEAVQTLLADKKYGFRGGLPVIQVIDDGVFRGYLPINHQWKNKDPLPYYNASKTIQKRTATQKIKQSYFSSFNLSGYQVVRGSYVCVNGEKPVVTFSSKKISFNSYCIKKFNDVQYIQILLHPTERRLAIRPCAKRDANSISWRKNEDAPYRMRTVNCTCFANALFEIMGWDPDFIFKAMGTWIKRENVQIIVFDLKNCIPLVMMDDIDKNGEKIKRRVSIYPETWENSFGEEFYAFSLNNMYYASTKQNLLLDAQSKMIEGQVPYEMMSKEEIEQIFKNLRTKGD